MILKWGPAIGRTPRRIKGLVSGLSCSSTPGKPKSCVRIKSKRRGRAVQLRCHWSLLGGLERCRARGLVHVRSSCTQIKYKTRAREESTGIRMLEWKSREEGATTAYGTSRLLSAPIARSALSRRSTRAHTTDPASRGLLAVHYLRVVRWLVLTTQVTVVQGGCHRTAPPPPRPHR